jgi:hypothetical protein
MKQPLQGRRDGRDLLHVELETEFSGSGAGIYQAIVWLPEEDQAEGGSVRLEIEKGRLPWSPAALRELAKTLLDVASALEAPTHEKRRNRLIQEAGFTKLVVPEGGGVSA